MNTTLHFGVSTDGSPFTGVAVTLSNGTMNTLQRREFQQIISDDMMWQLNVYLNILACGMAATVGTISNVCNIIVFYHLGLKDSMSVYLFALAVTDFMLSLVVLVTRTFPIWETFFSTKYVEPMDVKYVIFDWFADSLFMCSGWITAVLSMERCICVTFPFKVKEIFTRNRSNMAVIVIYIVCTVIYVPVYATQWLGLVGVEVLVMNQTRFEHQLVAFFHENRQRFEQPAGILGLIVPLPSLFITLGSVFWMTYGLRISSQLRSSMTRKGAENQETNISNKTRRLVIVVVFLAIIFTICSIPRLFAINVSRFLPEISLGGGERNMHVFQWQLSRFATAINASVNIFVYLTINTSYRGKFKELFFFIKTIKN